MVRCKQEGGHREPAGGGHLQNFTNEKCRFPLGLGGGYFFLPNLRPRSIAAITSIKSAIVLSMFMGVASFRSCRRRRALAYGLIIAHTLAHVRLHVAFAVLRDAFALGEELPRLYHGLARTETR